MRKLLFTLAFALMAMVTFAQGDHMTFKGIPMQGPLNAFVQKLKGKGFTLMNTKNEGAALKGKFATYDDCVILVDTEKGNVSSVGVVFPEQDTWGAIITRYYSLKDMLTEKYGTPISVEVFSNGDPGSDFSRFHAILDDECTYGSEFRTKNGSITLSLMKVNTRAWTAAVFIKYEDDKHEQARKKTMMDDL